MGTVLTVMCIATLLAILFGTIATDECRRLDRRLRRLEHQLGQATAEQGQRWAA